MQGIAVIDQLEHGLQQVIAIGAASGDVQKQVQLGRAGDNHGLQGVSVQSRRTKSSRKGAFSMRMRVGRDSMS